MQHTTIRARRVPALEGYQLLEKIGEGGMGTVYKARDQRAGELVAVKLIYPSDHGASTAVQRFEQEFRAALQLDHPNIVKVRDFGCTKNAHFMVMELVDGVSLAKHIAERGRLPEPEAVGLIVQAATALHYVHQKKLVHRDVKPDNLLLTKQGKVKLTDLGLVKVLDEQANLTRPNSGLGTPNYTAPEQFNDAKNADARCDIYSLGATLYTAVTGEVPFGAATPLNVLKKKLSCDLAPARSLVPGRSERLCAAITRAMNLDPRRRHPSCAEFIADLTGKKSSQTVQVCRVEDPPASQTIPYPGKERRRHVRHASRQEGQCLPFAADKQEQWDARVNDVSETGVSLTINRRFEIGTLLMLWLPGASGAGAGKFVVRVMRRQGCPARKWRHGCHFLHPISEEELQALV